MNEPCDKIVILGSPIAKARPKFARRGKFTATYNTQETEEGRFLLAAQYQWRKPPLVGPLAIDLIFVMPRPKAHYGTGKNAKILKLTSPRYHSAKKRFDVDNCIKFVLDCLNELIYEDDGQVAAISAVKRYGKRPRTEIFIRELERVEIGGKNDRD